jgi:hypothetical protein
MRSIIRWLGSIVLLLVASAVPVGAQRKIVEDADPVVLRERMARCPVAIEILATGRSTRYREVTNTPDSSREAWARSAVSSCGPDGERAVARAMQRMSHSTDRVSLRELTAATRELRGPAVFAAAQAIAGDPSASPDARVLALRSLTWAVRPRLTIEYENYAGTAGAGCTRSAGPVMNAVSDTSAATVRSVVDLARRLMGDPATPPAVRHAAMCTRTNLWLSTSGVEE